jgi:hypothetical protein
MGSSGCCNRSETSGNMKELKDDDITKLGYNSRQKIKELKSYRFFINHLMNLMMVNNGVERKEFYFIRKSWIKSWSKYTSYEQIRPLLIKNEINNELDFQKIILDHKKEINFDGFMEKTKPGPIKFFEINQLNTNIKENFYIFDSKILKQFIGIYGIEDTEYNEGKEMFALEGEIGKGRIIFDVKEYTLIMFLNKSWEIKQIMVMFNTEAEHKHFVKSVFGRALTFISKELKKITQKKKMITYKKDEIFCYDNRDFIKYEYSNNNNVFEKTKSKNSKENIQEENLIQDMQKIKKNEFDKLTNLADPETKENENNKNKIMFQDDENNENIENNNNKENNNDNDIDIHQKEKIDISEHGMIKKVN